MIQSYPRPFWPYHRTDMKRRRANQGQGPGRRRGRRDRARLVEESVAGKTEALASTKRYGTRRYAHFPDLYCALYQTEFDS